MHVVVVVIIGSILNVLGIFIQGQSGGFYINIAAFCWCRCASRHLVHVCVCCKTTWDAFKPTCLPRHKDCWGELLAIVVHNEKRTT
jgi:hypothetical protein